MLSASAILTTSERRQMNKLKLTYFDFPGGRAEPARLAMHIGGVQFEDYRFSPGDFSEVRKTTPLNQVPTLHVNDLQITQSDAITRYVGKLSGLYPEDDLQALLCDEVMGALEDMIRAACSYIEDLVRDQVYQFMNSLSSAARSSGAVAMPRPCGRSRLHCDEQGGIDHDAAFLVLGSAGQALRQDADCRSGVL
jgi:hypothetical protein